MKLGKKAKMKTNWQIISVLSLFFTVQLLPAQIAPYGIANNDLGPVQSAPSDPSDSIVQLTADAQGLPPVPPDQVPLFGTFWTVIPGAGALAEPYPCPPPGVDLPTYALPDGSYLVDATATTNAITQADLAAQATLVVNLLGQAQTLAASQMVQPMSRAMAVGLPFPGAGGTNTYGDNVVTNNPSITPINYGTNLWLQIIGVSNVWANLLLSNTVADVEYEIQGLTNLTQTNWVSEGFVIGSETTNWTPASLAVFAPTNNLFLRIRSWADDGSGLANWWQSEFFGTNGVDPYADPAGDGYDNLYKFQHGMNPNVFYTPAAPQGVTVSYNTSNNIVMVSWMPSPGPVTNYAVNVSGTIYNVSPASNSFQAFYVDPYHDQFNGPTLNGYAGVVAEYAGGSSAVNPPIALQQPGLVGFNIVPGPDGSAYLGMTAPPPGTTNINISLVDEFAIFIGGGDYSYDTNYIISVSDFTNGLCLLPAALTMTPTDGYGNSDYTWYAAAEGTNDNDTAGTKIYYDNSNLPDGQYGLVTPFFDCRQQLKQNLIFHLRAATESGPFQFLEQEADGYHVISYPSKYVYSGFYQLDDSTGEYPSPDDQLGILDAFWPLDNNIRLRNFVFDSAYLSGSDGQLTTGVGDLGSIPVDGYYGLNLSYPITYELESLPSTGASISAVLATNQTRWLYVYDSHEYQDEGVENIGVHTNSSGAWTLSKTDSNYWGLSFVSVKIAYQSIGGVQTNTLYPGDTFTAPLPGEVVCFYPETAQPKFLTAAYDFWRQGLDAMPGQSSFSTTNDSRLMITPVGIPIQVSGFLDVCNG
jgi:hypothetical protein